MIDIREELSKNFIDFAAEANGQRAFPDARDGLKPGQRACLWEMYVKGYTSNKPHVKSAKVDGGVAATWWPHGTTAIYDTFARMSMPWINNIPEVDFHGSNGNQVIGAAPAADRYTEARLASASEQGFLSEMKKNPVPMIKNFSEDEEWPEVLPAIFPRLAVNGSQGIGVTVAQVWLPMNLGELTTAIKGYIHSGTLDVSEGLIDFPTKGIIINKNDLHIIHETGKGKVILRGRVEIKESSILITELPYQVYVEPFIDDIKKLIKEGTLTGIDDILNKSDKKRLLVEISCTENPEQVLKMLYAKTDLQKNFNANQFALVGKTPKMLTLKDYIDIYVQHNLNCIQKEYQFDLDKATKKLEVTQGLIKALVSIDDIIALIKQSDSSKDAIGKLVTKYEFTEVQAKAIVDMKLGRLAKLEAVELNKTEQGLQSDITEFNRILNSEANQKELFLTRLDAFTKKFGFPRRTQLMQIEIPKESKSKPEFIPEPCGIVITTAHTIKRMMKAAKPKTNEYLLMNQETNTGDWLSVFTAAGKMYKIQTKDIPEGTTASKGISVAALLEMGNDTPVAYFLHSQFGEGTLLFVTSRGQIKCAKMEEFTSTRKGGIIATKLREGDLVAAVMEYHGEDVEIITKKGMSIHLRSGDIPTQGKNTLGVKGMNVAEDDSVAQVLSISKDTIGLVVIAETGQGKRVPVSELPPQGRGGKGVSITPKNDFAGAVFITKEDSRILFVMPSTVKSESARQIPVHSRVNTGVQIIKPIGKIAYVVLGS
jgi:DNA gyrase subunit A